MPWHPDAIRKEISRYRPSVRPAMHAHRRVILHTAVYDGPSLYPMMSNPGTATSHFYVRSGGAIEQYASTAVQSSANLEGNPDCITIETEDNYPHGWSGSNGAPPWTEAQLDSLADICRWAHKVHGIPIRRLKNSRFGTRGIGIHRQGIDGNFRGGIFRGRVPGGQHWSSSFGKTCVTDPRIEQWKEVIRRARRGGRNYGFVNRSRVNRVLMDPDGHIGKLARKQLNNLDDALDAHGWPAVGYPKYARSLRRAVRNFQRQQGWTGEDANGLLGPATCRRLGLRSKRGNILRRKSINMDHLQGAYSRPRGRVYNPWGKKANRRWHKGLKDVHRSGPKWNWTRAWFDKHLRASTYHANKDFGITKWTGPNNDRPTWELAERLNLNPYRTKEKG